MKKYEVRIWISDPDYVNELILSLVRQGYNVYFNKEEGSHGVVCFTVNEGDSIEEVLRR